MASMPVAAVTWAGKPSVSSGSRIAQSGSNLGETTPFFSVVVEVVRRLGEIGHELGGIERAAAADRGDQFDFLVTAKRYRPLDDMRWRIRLHIFEYREFAAAGDQARLGIF